MGRKWKAIVREMAIKTLAFLPDKAYISLMFRMKMGRAMNWKDPETFNEKINWLKLYDRKPSYTNEVDKYQAKEYVAGMIGEEYIIPNIGVWDRFEDIDFDSLPRQFVLKCTHDSGGLVICRDKFTFDRAAARTKINRSLRTNYYLYGREWPYKHVKPRIIAEEYMPALCAQGDELQKEAGLLDYKFYCFAGEPKFLYVSQGWENHDTTRVSFLTMDWQFAPYKRLDYGAFQTLPPKPEKFDEMVRLCRVLAAGHAFLRVDLYQIGEKVYFSELTFSPCCGYMPFQNPEHDRELGKLIVLPKKENARG